jgi:ribosome biogenesis protein ERB1
MKRSLSSSDEDASPQLTALSASDFDFVSDDDFSDLGGHSSDSDEDDERITAAEFEHQIAKYGMGFKPEILPVYESDTSDEENENTCGDVPLKWYDEYDHVGYNIDGNKIARGATKDEVDKFLENSDSRDVWRSVLNVQGETVQLSSEELQIVDRIERGLYGDISYDPFERTVEWFTSKLEIMPLSAAPEPKRRFIPSKNEAKRV